mgnify:CR=1 FL=1
MNVSKEETLAKAGKNLMLKEPFYGLFLMALNKIWNPKLIVKGQGTMGVTLKGINYELHIEPEFWNNLTPEQQPYLLKHEVLHIALFHLTDYSHLVHKDILNMAMDIEINQIIGKENLPEYGCFFENFPELNMEPMKGTHYYYEKLLEAKEQGQACMQTINDFCNGGQGGNTESDDEGDGNDGLCELPNGQKIKIPSHIWEEIVDKLPEVTKKLIASQTGHILNQVAEQVIKSRGTVPGEIAEILERINTITPPKFDWKGYMRRFVGNSTRTYTKTTKNKYNRRVSDNPGIRIKFQKHVLAAVDTSGSVSTGELKEFLNELHHIKKLGAEVTILQFDTQIQHIGKFNPKNDLTIHGRGGTDFNECMNFYIENKNRFSCMMVFTDGEAPVPEHSSRNVLWVLSEQSNMNSDLPGQVIKLEL